MSLHTAGMLQLLQPLLGKRDTQTSLVSQFACKDMHTNGHKSAKIIYIHVFDHLNTISIFHLIQRPKCKVQSCFVTNILFFFKNPCTCD